MVASLTHLLELSLGADEAGRTMCDAVAGVARGSGTGPGGAEASGRPQPAPGDLDRRVDGINRNGLAAQVWYVVRALGKARARHYLREITDFEMVPKPGMFGV